MFFLKRYVDYGPRCHCFDGVFGLRLDVNQIGNIYKFCPKKELN